MMSRRARRILLFVPSCLVLLGLLLAINHYRKINLENDNRALCREKLKIIGKAIIYYSNDHKNLWPSSLELLVSQGRLKSEDLHCPSARNGSSASNYTYCLALPDRDPRRMMHMSSYPAEAVVMFDHAENHHNGINLLFADGHPEFVLFGEQNDLARAIMRHVESGYRPIWWDEFTTQPSK